MDRGKRPLFSVIVPVYKVEKYLNQCVDSILTQTFADFEVILVDDGSPDGCGAICDEYAQKDSRVKVIHKENGGNVSARRAGYKLCTGQYIVHVDSDDYIAADLLAMAEEQIRTNAVDAVLFGFTRFDETGEEKHFQHIAAGLYDGQKMDTIRRNLILGEDSGVAIYNGLCLLIMRKEVFEPHLEAVPEALYRGEDLAAVAPALAQCGAVYVLQQCPYYYRSTPGSIMNTYRGDELEQAMLLADFLLDRMGEEYARRLDSYVLKACYEHLTHHRDSWQQYRQELSKILNDRLRGHLRRAQCGSQAHISERLVFFLLGHQMFRLLWLIWKIRA